MIVEIPGHIQQKMIEYIRRANLKATEHNRLLSIGKMYHTLSLVTEDNQPQDTVVIYVQQYKPQFVRLISKKGPSKDIIFFQICFSTKISAL